MGTKSITQNNATSFYNSAEDSEIGGHFHFPQSKILEMVESFSYSGEDFLPVSISRDNIVAEHDEGLTGILSDELDNKHDVPFMPIDVEEFNDYICKIAHYVLRLYGPLINGQKAIVTIADIKVFFDIRVPSEKDAHLIEHKIKTILASGKDANKTVDMDHIKFEHIKAFPIRSYYKEK